MLFQTGGMSHEQSGLMSSVMKKGIQQSTKTPMRMPTMRAAFFSFCSLHVSPSVWNVTVAWRTVKTICGCWADSFTCQTQTQVAPYVPQSGDPTQQVQSPTMTMRAKAPGETQDIHITLWLRGGWLYDLFWVMETILSEIRNSLRVHGVARTAAR